MKYRPRKKSRSKRTPYNRWTTGELKYLREHYSVDATAAIAKYLNRTPATCRTMANKLGLAAAGAPDWTPRETRFLVENIRTRGPQYIAEKLGITLDRVRHRARSLGLPFRLFPNKVKRQKLYEVEPVHKSTFKAPKRHGAASRWSEEEVQFLRDHAYAWTYEEIGRALCRGAKAVSTKASAIGVHKVTQHFWTTSELRKIKALHGKMTVRELAKRMEVPYGSLQKVIARMGTLPSKFKQFTPMELEYIAQNYYLKSSWVIGAELGMKYFNVLHTIRRFDLVSKAGPRPEFVTREVKPYGSKNDPRYLPKRLTPLQLEAAVLAGRRRLSNRKRS